MAKKTTKKQTAKVSPKDALTPPDEIIDGTEINPKIEKDEAPSEDLAEAIEEKQEEFKAEKPSCKKKGYEEIAFNWNAGTLEEYMRKASESYSESSRNDFLNAVINTARKILQP